MKNPFYDESGEKLVQSKFIEINRVKKPVCVVEVERIHKYFMLSTLRNFILGYENDENI